MSERTRKLIKYVVPTMLGSISFFLFTIVDGIFVGRGVGRNALGAVNLVMPFVMVVNALFQLTTIGGVAIIAVRLGRGDVQGANHAFMHAVAGTVVISALLMLSGTCLTGPLCRLMGASDTFYRLTTEYLFWYSVFIIPSGLSTALQGFCRNDGSPVLVSAATIIGTAVNIVGDYLLIFPLKMGVAGAAIATGVSQLVTFLIILSHFIRKQGVLRFCRFRVEGALLNKIAVRGLPACIAQFANPMTTLWINKMLAQQLGDIAVNAYSIISYVATFSMGVFFGVSDGLQPLYGQSYGAKDARSLRYYFRAGSIINLAGSLIINGALFLVGGAVCALFGADAATLAYTVRVMPLYSWGFVVVGLTTNISSYMYSTKRSREADVISILRSFVFNTIIILLLPRILGGDVIWHTFGIAETVVLLISVFLLKRSERSGIEFN